jgi:hypothetical protein
LWVAVDVPTRAMEISHTWIIQLRDPSYNEWISLYEVKPSTLLCILKPQAMFYDIFLEQFKKLYSEVGEINIRNRYMLAIGKCWLKAIVKYGLWIETKDMNRCHRVLKAMMDDKAGDFEHSSKTGSNVPQVAAYVCQPPDQWSPTLEMVFLR